jgi:hypothetical protein
MQEVSKEKEPVAKQHNLGQFAVSYLFCFRFSAPDFIPTFGLYSKDWPQTNAQDVINGMFKLFCYVLLRQWNINDL